MKVYSVLTNFVFIPPTNEFSIAYISDLRYLLQFIVRVDNNMFGILFLEHSLHPSDKNVLSDYLKKRAP